MQNRDVYSVARKVCGAAAAAVLAATLLNGSSMQAQQAANAARQNWD